MPARFRSAAHTLIGCSREDIHLDRGESFPQQADAIHSHVCGPRHRDSLRMLWRYRQRRARVAVVPGVPGTIERFIHEPRRHIITRSGLHESLRRHIACPLRQNPQSTERARILPIAWGRSVCEAQRPRAQSRRQHPEAIVSFADFRTRCHTIMQPLRRQPLRLIRQIAWVRCIRLQKAQGATTTH